MMNENFLLLSKMQDIGRWYITSFVKNVAENLPINASILDAGAGECVYKRYFSHCEYKSIDLAIGETRWNYNNLDYVGALHDMPVPDNIFDAVLCTQVLEHLEWPRESVKEMYRVLKPGGTLYMTAPMAHPEHQQPYDFFRYTSYGLQSLCHQAGFKDVTVSPFGGLWVRWAYELPRGLTIFPPAGIRNKTPNPAGIVLLPFRLVMKMMISLLQRLFLWCDRFDSNKDDPFGWSCIARK